MEKMDLVEVDDLDTSHIHFLFVPAPQCDRVVFEAKNLSKSYQNQHRHCGLDPQSPDNTGMLKQVQHDGTVSVLNNLNFVVQRGEKIAFVGRNGEGKTTLIRLLHQELPITSGELSIGSTVKIGYYAQNQNSLLNPNKTVFQTIDDVAVGDMRTKVRGILGSFLFGNDDIEKKVSVLSGGEKARLALAMLLLNPYNVLILDEPTNHLDMQSKDVLKNALLRYNGTLILVSHDRDFLQGLTDKVFEFKDGNIKEYLGDIQYYIEKRKLDSLQSLELKSQKTEQISKDGKTENKLSWEEQKQYDSQLRKLTKQLEKEEETITKLEKELESLTRKLSDTEHYQAEIASGELYKQYRTAQTALEQAMTAWEEVVNALNNLST